VPTPETLGDIPEAADEEGFEQRTISRLTLNDALEKLSVRDRELIALRYGADLTSAQIAARLGLSTNAVEVALHRALARLRGHLDPPRSDAPRLVPVQARSL
jgi:RNA polymerase sigma factor (sigma-70 family)